MGRQQQALILVPPKAQQEVISTHLKYFGDDCTGQAWLEMIRESFEYKDIHDGPIEWVRLSIQQSIANTLHA